MAKANAKNDPSSGGSSAGGVTKPGGVSTISDGGGTTIGAGSTSITPTPNGVVGGKPKKKARFDLKDDEAPAEEGEDEAFLPEGNKGGPEGSGSNKKKTVHILSASSVETPSGK